MALRFHSSTGSIMLITIRDSCRIKQNQIYDVGFRYPCQLSPLESIQLGLAFDDDCASVPEWTWRCFRSRGSQDMSTWVSFNFFFPIKWLNIGILHVPSCLDHCHSLWPSWVLLGGIKRRSLTTVFSSVITFDQEVHELISAGCLSMLTSCPLPRSN